MKKICFALSIFLQLQGICQSERSAVKKLQKGKVKEDTSYVYWLPYKELTKHLMVQGYYSKHSHKNLIANDFKMKSGTTICASRGGIVSNVYDQSNIGGLKDKENHWNYVIIMHQDSSSALYGHIQQNGALVKVGDTIKIGQPIAISGNTGYSAFPHLHFCVFDKAKNQIPVRFLTTKGKVYLRSFRFYKAITL